MRHLPWEMFKIKVLEVQRCPCQGSLTSLCERLLWMGQVLG